MAQVYEVASKAQARMFVALTFQTNEYKRVDVRKSRFTNSDYVLHEFKPVGSDLEGGSFIESYVPDENGGYKFESVAILKGNVLVAEIFVKQP